jgi:CheY-like chemotaxis protein
MFPVLGAISGWCSTICSIGASFGAPYANQACSAGWRIAIGQPSAQRFRRLPPIVNPAAKAIVVVDDEKSYTDLITQLLSDNLDCPVHGFTRPLDALKAIPQLNPAVIVTDYFMPQLNGIEFIREATPLAPTAAFVMITGHNLSEEEDALAKLKSLKGFLTKPFGWRKLAEEIVRVWPPGTAAPAQGADATSV